MLGPDGGRNQHGGRGPADLQACGVPSAPPAAGGQAGKGGGATPAGFPLMSSQRISILFCNWESALKPFFSYDFSKQEDDMASKGVMPSGRQLRVRKFKGQLQHLAAVFSALGNLPEVPPVGILR